MHHGKRVKIFRVTRNLNRPKTKMIMANITPHIEMRVKVIYSLESVIYRGGGGKKDMFTSWKDIQAYIEERGQKWLDLDNEEVWSKAYLPATRTTEVRGNYQGKVVFKHFQIRLVAWTEPLMSCGPLLNWLRNKGCIYARENFDDNLCVWMCPIYKRTRCI